MSEQTEISWTDSTFNPWFGCTKVGPGCDHCYAEGLMATRYGKVEWGTGKPRVRTSAANWRKPVQWNDKPFYQCGCGFRGTIRELMVDGAVHACGLKFTETRRRVFCSSLADVFDNEADPLWQADLFKLILDTPNLDWLLLTKRIGNVPKIAPHAWTHEVWPRNVWLGATIVNEEERLRDAAKLKAIRAAVTFWSVEPMLGDLGTIPRDQMPGWVIAGGESGPGARPVHPDWIRSLRDQCAAARVPFHFKQWGEWKPGSKDFSGGSAIALDGRIVADGFDVRSYPKGADSGDGWSMIHRAGKKAAGRELDGRTHDGFPLVAA